MNMSASKMRLATLTKELAARWAQTKEHWRDAKSEEFERHYLDDLLASVDTTVVVIEQLDALVRKIRSDCE